MMARGGITPPSVTIIFIGVIVIIIIIELRHWRAGARCCHTLMIVCAYYLHDVTFVEIERYGYEILLLR